MAKEKKSRVENKIVRKAGVGAGFLAGALMALVINYVAHVDGSGFWQPMKNVAAVWFGEQALQGGAGIVLAGLLTHLAIAGILGFVFGFLTKKVESASSEIVAGVVYSMVVWAIMTYLVLPFFNPVMFESVTAITAWWFGSHLVFGIVLGATAPLKRRIGRRLTRQAHYTPPGSLHKGGSLKI